MVIIVDTDILISASLNANSGLYNIIVSNFTKINFVTPEFALKEIFNHQKSICSKTKTSPSIFKDNLSTLLSHIFLLPDADLTDSHISEAEIISKEIDADDSIFIAFALELNCLLWTGDKKLIKDVRKNGFINITNTIDFKRILKGL